MCGIGLCIYLECSLFHHILTWAHDPKCYESLHKTSKSSYSKLQIILLYSVKSSLLFGALHFRVPSSVLHQSSRWQQNPQMHFWFLNFLITLFFLCQVGNPNLELLSALSAKYIKVPCDHLVRGEGGLDQVVTGQMMRIHWFRNRFKNWANRIYRKIGYGV